jgi:hypothetical protein
VLYRRSICAVQKEDQYFDGVRCHRDHTGASDESVLRHDVKTSFAQSLNIKLTAGGVCVKHQ